MRNRQARSTLPSGRSAADVATCEIADCRKLIKLLESELDDLQSYTDAEPRNWGMAGSASHVREGLEDVAMFLDRGNDCDSEDENRRAIRSVAGIAVDRVWN